MCFYCCMYNSFRPTSELNLSEHFNRLFIKTTPKSGCSKSGMPRFKIRECTSVKLARNPSEVSLFTSELEVGTYSLIKVPDFVTWKCFPINIVPWEYYVPDDFIVHSNLLGYTFALRKASKSHGSIVIGPFRPITRHGHRRIV